MAKKEAVQSRKISAGRNIPKQTKRKTKTQKGAGKTIRVLPFWAISVTQPWGDTLAHIPDASVTDSGLCTSRVQFSGAPVSIGAQSTHQWGLFIPAYPTWTFLADLGVAGVSDVNLTGTAYTTPFSGATQSLPQTPPNFAALLGSSNSAQRTRIRCTGIGVTVTYEGTELNRSGRISAGLVPMTGRGTTAAGTGTVISGVGAALGVGPNSIAITPQILRDQSTSFYECRNNDRTNTFRWKPAGTPEYQVVSTLNPSDYTAVAGVDPTGDTPWFHPVGGAGVQSGQNALIIIMDGDNNGVSSTTGSVYTVNIYWHWEVIPDQPNSVAYSLSPSISNANMMDVCLNYFHNLAISPTPGNGASVA